MEDDDFGAENLEDGELWLPSDFFSMDEVQASTKISASPKSSCMERPGFSSSNFLERQPCLPALFKALPTLQHIESAVQYRSTDGAYGGGGGGVYGGAVGNLCGCGIESSFTGRSPAFRFQRLRPVQTQADTFMGERAWVLLQMQQRFNRINLNRVSPVARIGGHGGTGVFLPRTSSNIPTATVTRKGQRMIDKRENQLPPRKILLNRRQEECRGYTTPGPEMEVQVRAPQDWNY